MTSYPPVKFRDLNDLTYKQINKLLGIFEKEYDEKIGTIGINRRHDQSLLVRLLNEYEFDKRVGLDYKAIHDEIHLVWNTEKDQPEPEQVEEYFDERRGYDDPEDEIYNLMRQREEIDNRIKELQEIESVMNIPASDSPMKLSHEERYHNYVNETTQGILNGEFDESLNAELTKFVKKHSLKYIECDDAILLFEPRDMEKFKQALRRISYAQNSMKKEDHDIYINYYLNRCTELGFIFDSLDKIYEENKNEAFKIGFDCGFIVEDTKDVTYSRTAPTDEETGRSIPVIIKNKSDMETYKHYVYSAISEKTELTHKNSSQHYCAIHTVLFKVTKLGMSGAKVCIPGYDFLMKNKYIIGSPSEYNLCMFYAMCCKPF